MREELNRAIDMLISESVSLKDLADISGRDTFSFYNGADLSGLDLSGQDLRGLSFEYADFRSSNLSSINYDEGSFNNSHLDSIYSLLKDDFHFSCQDVLDFPNEEILVFVQFRDGIVDLILRAIDLNFKSFSSSATVSESALRKARNGKTVALETAKSIIQRSIILLDQAPNDLLDRAHLALRQSNVKLLIGGNNSAFSNLTRDRLRKLFEVRAYRINVLSGSDYRDTGESLDYWARHIETISIFGEDSAPVFTTTANFPLP